MLPMHSCNGAVIHSKVLHWHFSSKDLLKNVLFNMVVIQTQKCDKPKALRFRSTYWRIHTVFTVYCVWLHTLVSFSCLLFLMWYLTLHSISTYWEEFFPQETSFSDMESHHALILLCHSKVCTMNMTTSNPHGWQNDSVLPFVSCSASLLPYSCAVSLQFLSSK